MKGNGKGDPSFIDLVCVKLIELFIKRAESGILQRRMKEETDPIGAKGMCRTISQARGNNV